MRRIAILLLVYLLAACRPPVVVSTDSSSQARTRPERAPRAPPPPSPPRTPRCPEQMEGQRPLAALIGEALRPGAWHPDSSANTLGFAGAWRERSRIDSTAGPRTLEWVSAFTPSIGAVALFTPQAGGVCVVNAWTAYFPANVRDVRITDAWRSTEAKLAIALVRLTLEGEPPTWIVIGTDGLTAWFALEQGGAYQLPVPKMALSPTGDRLYLDITQRRTTRFVLRANGRFERLGP